jgi:hypothetical protein
MKSMSLQCGKGTLMNKVKSPKMRLNFPEIALPWHQQLVMRLYLGPFVASSSGIDRNSEHYETFGRKIIRLAEEIPFDQHRVPVLVPAQAGLLENTRYWSISQTLEYLLKMDRLSKDIILKLAVGESPNMAIATDALAPEGKCDPERILLDYKASLPRNLDEINAALRKTHSRLTELHPWFGRFDAKQWYWAMATGASQRYRQLKNIRKGLSFDPASERRLSLLPGSPGV